MKIDINGTIVPNEDEWIYDWFGMPCVAPLSVKNMISDAEKSGEKLDVYINSEGGDIFAGSEIYAALREYSGEVEIHIVGLAASAASVIACAGYCDIAPTAMVMVHNVSSYAAGDYHDMDKQSEVLQKANQAIAAAYIAKTGMSEKKALELMDTETWLSATDTVKLGLADKIAESKNAVKLAASANGMLPASVIQKIRNTVKPPQKCDDSIKTKLQAQLAVLKLRRIQHD